MSKRRVRSVRPARRVIRTSRPSQTLETRRASSGQAAASGGDLDQDLVVARPWRAAGSRRRAGRRWPGKRRARQPLPAGARRARLEPELLGAAQHLRHADRVGAEPMADLVRDRRAMPWKRSNVTRASSPGSAGRGPSGFGAHARLSGATSSRSGVRLRQQRRLVRGRIGDRRPALARARRREGRCHGLAEQRRRRRRGVAALRTTLLPGAAVEDVLAAAADQDVVAGAAEAACRCRRRRSGRRRRRRRWP